MSYAPLVFSSPSLVQDNDCSPSAPSSCRLTSSMKRTSGKIKDLVEAQAFEVLGNYAADPQRALAIYRFTEATAELLTRWLDVLADLPRAVAGEGAGENLKQHCRALAGPRGAGKSHALTAFSALLAHPELRTTVAETHVATSARRMGSRRFTIVRVERGTHTTLEEEIIAALDSALGVEPVAGDSASESACTEKVQRFPEHVVVAASRLVDAPLVFVIDTAYGRSQRVARDDGAILTELVRTARSVGGFVALALDDDIAGADGANVELAQTFPIDYLDPEHLFRVADSYVLRKTPTGRLALHDIYNGLREAVPGFNWSESRFGALYPVHPVVAEIASAVRLYAQTFALLPFASETAQRAAGRPPHSLVTLDEVFDRAEYDLRHSTALAGAFSAYDDLAARAIAQMPVMSRLQARLVLKALFVLSLDGRGVTATEVCAAMLLDDEAMGGDARGLTEEALMMFASLPAEGEQSSAVERIEDGGGWRYRFVINAAENFEKALLAAIDRTPLMMDRLDQILREAAHLRFPDMPLATGEEAVGATVELFLLWHGTHRAGQLVCGVGRDGASQTDCAGVEPVAQEETVGGDVGTANPGVDIELSAADRVNATGALCSANFTHDVQSRSFEWRVLLLPVAPPDASASSSELQRIAPELTHTSAPARATFTWRPAALKDDETALLRRLAALTNDAALVSEFAEQSHAALATIAAQTERIWARIYLEEGEFALVETDGNLNGETVTSPENSAPQRLTGEACAAPTLARALASTLDAHFACCYPAHPAFAEPFGEREVARLATNLFGGVNVADEVVQRDAEFFALPLSLVSRREHLFQLATNDELLKLAFVQAVVQKVLAANGQTVALTTIGDLLGAPPYGLTADAQRLVLAALVANRQLEFTTAAGERLARRALGSGVKWTDVTGVVRAGGITTSIEELTAWGRLLTNALAPLDDIEAEFARSKQGGAISAPETRDEVRRKLVEWFATWRDEEVLGRCERLSDAWLTIRNAGLMQTARRSFGVAASAIEATISGDIELEEGLQRVADAFANSPVAFSDAARQLGKLTFFAQSFERRERRRRYLLGIEHLPDAELTDHYHRLQALGNDSQNLDDAETRGAEFDSAWEDFHRLYTEHYVARHVAHFGSDEPHRVLDQIMRSETWRELEVLSELPLLGEDRFRRLNQSFHQASGSQCLLVAEEVRELLQNQPTCICAFRSSSTALVVEQASELEAVARAELDAYRRTLARLSLHLAEALRACAETEEVMARREQAERLAEEFAAGNVPLNLTRADVELMRRAIAGVAAPPPLRIELPVSCHELLTPAELGARVRQWLDELPGEVHIVRIGGEQDIHTASLPV